jgi:hypothetical protein
MRSSSSDRSGYLAREMGSSSEQSACPSPTASPSAAAQRLSTRNVDSEQRLSPGPATAKPQKSASARARTSRTRDSRAPGPLPLFAHLDFARAAVLADQAGLRTEHVPPPLRPPAAPAPPLAPVRGRLARTQQSYGHGIRGMGSKQGVRGEEGGAPALDGADVGLGRADGRRPRHRGPRRVHHLKPTGGKRWRAAGNADDGREGRTRSGGLGDGTGAHRVGDAVRHADEPLAPHKLPQTAAEAVIRPRGDGRMRGRAGRFAAAAAGGPCRGGTRRRRGGACSRRARRAPARRGPPCPAHAAERQPAPLHTRRGARALGAG